MHIIGRELIEGYGREKAVELIKSQVIQNTARELANHVEIEIEDDMLRGEIKVRGKLYLAREK